ncbi:ABC-type dipeptide transport system, periplasmic component [Candidatus Vecturithrix granuli]|uniref:ABC-type dipeptide transport system, periplasmic component n=1 Tax=Vecturithrix granuli TaxID=1499967 RepID=A0A081BVR7_VECG1|nr:ABC-type dipeptide transport system, periplasmic component [Candidatus Vecturithrix granuli]
MYLFPKRCSSQDAQFVSGNPVSADDVVFSLSRVIVLNGDMAWLLKQFGITEASIVKIDDDTVQIGLQKQYAPGVFFACLAHAVASILDQELVLEHEENGDLGQSWLKDHSAGSGRFIVAEREQGKETILTANPYYSKKVAPIQKVIVKNIEEPIEQAVSLEQGEIDIAWDLQPDDVMRMESDPQLQTFSAPLFQLRYVAMNMTHPPFDKPEVRDAVRYSIDYDGIMEYILQGIGTKIQTIIPQGVFGYNPAMPYQLDLAKAKQLLQDAGYPNGFEVEFICLNHSPWLDMAMKIKSDLANVGIQVTVNPLDYSQMVKKVMSREYQMFLLRWGFDYVDPDAVAKPFVHCDSDGEDATVKILAWVTHYCDRERSKFVEDAAQELDTAKREEMYRQITNEVLDNGPYAILDVPQKLFAVRQDIKDLISMPSLLSNEFPVLK